MVTLKRGTTVDPPVNLMFTRRTMRKMLACGIAVTRLLEGTKFVDHWLCTKEIVFYFGHPWDAAHQLTYHRTSLIIIALVMCTQCAHLWVADRRETMVKRLYIKT